MIDGSLTVSDLRQIVSIGEIFEEHVGKPMTLDELGEKLKMRGFKRGNRMSREIEDLETKLSGKRARYQKAGVPEYSIVDPFEHKLEQLVLRDSA